MLVYECQSGRRKWGAPSPNVGLANVWMRRLMWGAHALQTATSSQTPVGLFPSPPPLPPFHLHPDGRPFHSANTQTDTDTNSGIGRKNYSIHSRFTSRNFTRRKCLSHEAKRSLCNRKCVGDCECCSCIPGMFSYYTHFGNKKKTFLSLANNSPEKRREADSVLYIAIGPLSLPLAYIQHTHRGTRTHTRSPIHSKSYCPYRLHAGRLLLLHHRPHRAEYNIGVFVHIRHEYMSQVTIFHTK